MAINAISRLQFIELLPEHDLMEAISGEQVAWWADQARSIIGTVGKGRGEHDWAYAMLARDENGTYRVCKLRSGISSRLTASAQLHHVMRRWKQPSDGHTAAKPKLD